MRHINLGLALIAAMVFMASCASSQHRVTEERITSAEHMAGTAIDVKADNGAVEIIADPQMGGSVQIAAKITCAGDTEEEAAQRVADTELIIQRNADNVLTVSAQFPKTRRGPDAAAFTIRVPEADGVNVRTGNGRITVTNLGGAATLHTSNGAITLTDHRGPADVSTSNGKVTIDRLAGDLKAKTSNGQVTISDLQGAASVRTSNGAITVALHPDHSGPLDLHSGNGAIHAKVGRAFAGQVRFHTGNGSIRFSENGGNVKSKAINKSSGTVTIGEGGGESKLDSGNGSITFEIVQ